MVSPISSIAGPRRRRSAGTAGEVMTERPESNEPPAAGPAEFPWGHMLWFCRQTIGSTDGITMGRRVMVPGESSDTRQSDGREEAIYLIRGRVRHELVDRAIVQESGDFLAIPAGSIHRTTNVGDEEAELIIAFGSGDPGHPTAH
jgi:quercetin dioxygenase-like cupin family protein